MRRSWWFTAGLVLALATPALAAERAGRTVLNPSTPAAALTPAERDTRLQKVQAVLQNAIQQKLVRKVDAKVVAADARRLARTLSDEQVSALLSGGDATGLITLEGGRRTPAGRTAALTQ